MHYNPSGLDFDKSISASEILYNVNKVVGGIMELFLMKVDSNIGPWPWARLLSPLSMTLFGSIARILHLHWPRASRFVQEGGG